LALHLLNEYEGITPREAQQLYLTVCVLHRLGVPVRAGLISRIHGIPFEEFRSRLFRPLEHVVRVSQLPWGDYAYSARHQEIAQIIFEQVLTDPVERFNEYVRLVRSLNILYSVDLEALRGMLRAKVVHDLFPNHDDAQAIYDAAAETLRDDPYFLQQQANYERIRPNGNLRVAKSLLQQAREEWPHDSTIVHTLAEVLRAQAEQSDKPLERARLRNETRAVLKGISPSAPAARYATVTELKLATDEVRDLLVDPNSADRALDDAIRYAERAFDTAKQKYPGDKYILVLESEFAQLLQNHDRSFRVLSQARAFNPRDPLIASRLAALLVAREDADTARAYVHEALEGNRNDKRLNYQYAELLRTDQPPRPDLLAYHYRRAFQKGDENYVSQFWYARFAFESNDLNDQRGSKEIFRDLRDAPISHEDRVRVRDILGGPNNPRLFSGAIIRVEATHGFISVDGRGEVVFFHRSDAPEPVWERLVTGKRVAFEIGFSLRGPKALNVRLEGGSTGD
jgi:cold shock CspA family protein/Flp pilus assembly protein TadD